MRAWVIILVLLMACVPVMAQDDGTPPPLTDREPTPEQLEAYLQAYFRAENGYDLRIWWQNEPVRYTDVNGDGEDDLIADSLSYVAVLLWQDNKYSEPFHLQRSSGRIHESRVSLQDVTNDGTPEVVFDHVTSYTGSDMGGMIYGRDVIHCTAEGCTIVWQGNLFDEYHAHFPTAKLARMEQAGHDHHYDDLHDDRTEAHRHRSVVRRVIAGNARQATDDSAEEELSDQTAPHEPEERYGHPEECSRGQGGHHRLPFASTLVTQAQP